MPIPNAPELAPAASMATTDKSVDGIKCEQNARLVFHVHTHVTVFVNGKQRAIPAGIGIYPPIGPQNYRGDQFGVTAENCITWLSTRYADGLIHVESSEQRSFVLGDFFKVWGQPLSSGQVGPERGNVTTIVDGKVWTGDPSDIPLGSHTQIQLQVGTPLVAPQTIESRRAGSRRSSSWCSSASSSSACSPTAPTRRSRRCRRGSSTRRRHALHRRGRQPRPAGVPAQRADGVRLGVRARRLPRSRLHRRLPAPLGRPRARPYGGAVSDAAVRRTVEDLRANRYDEKTDTLRSAPRRRRRSESSCRYYSRFFSDPTSEHGLRPDVITDPDDLRELTAFFAWTAWAAAAERPGHDYSYTNNWPPEPLVGNTLTGERDRVERAVADRAARRDRPALRRLRPLGAAASAGTGASRRRSRSAAGRRRADARPAGDRLVLPRRGGALPAPDPRRRRDRSTTGSRSATSSASTCRSVFPYNLMRTWHLQLAIFCVATAFVAAGIFLAPLIAGREPQRQGMLAVRAARRARGRRLRHADRRATSRSTACCRRGVDLVRASRAGSTSTSAGSG